MPLIILALVHEDLVPPDSIDGLPDAEVQPFKMEFDVIATLREMGHEVVPLGAWGDLSPIQSAVERLEPDIAFNLLEEFLGVHVFDSHVAAFLEMIRLPYTGCNPRGLMLAHDKALSKMVLRHHRIPTPRFATFRRGRKVRRPKSLAFPLIVKSLTAEGSVGIAQASVVHDEAALAERIELVHRQVETDAIAEGYIDGREVYVGVVGNDRLTTLPIWELRWPDLRPGAPRIATDRVKWDYDYQEQIGLVSGPAEDLPGDLATRLPRLAKRAYRALSLSGYARLDFRIDAAGKAYLLEANPNPQLAYGEDFAESAEHGGLSYETLLQRIVDLGLAYRHDARG